MTSKRKPPERSTRGDSGPFKRRKTSVVARTRAGSGGWELIHPRCARERTSDLEEVQTMIADGENEIAMDELRWLLEECGDCIAAHRLLGELAIEQQDLQLGRAHFGHAFELGWSALAAANATGEAPYRHKPNQAFLESGKGLAHCLKELNKPRLAAAVCRELLRLDASDPLGVGQWLPDLQQAAQANRKKSLEEDS